MNFDYTSMDKRRLNVYKRKIQEFLILKNSGEKLRKGKSQFYVLIQFLLYVAIQDANWHRRGSSLRMAPKYIILP